MFKKTVRCIIAASAIYCSLSGISSEASAAQLQWNDSALTQQQNLNGSWDKIIQLQQGRIDGIQTQVSTSKGTSQGQSAFVTGFQVQSGKTNGSASASQIDKRVISVGDQQTNGSLTLEQTTEGIGSIEQSTVVEDPAYVIQAQSTTNAIFHFQGSIQGGPSLQIQMSQIHSYQYSTVILKP